MGLTARERKAHDRLRQAVIVLANDLTANGALTRSAQDRLQNLLQADEPADKEKGGRRE